VRFSTFKSRPLPPVRGLDSIRLWPLCMEFLSQHLSQRTRRIYNDFLRGVRRAILQTGLREHFFDSQLLLEKNMSDPISKIKQRLQEEIDHLEHELSVELPKEIAKARAHGDLSENAEYKFAKERQGFVNARIAQLKKRMGDLGMLNLSNIPKDRSGYGSRIVVLDVNREVEIEYKLVTTEEADAEKGLISTTSPIGRALLNRKVGDEVHVATPAGSKEFEIVRLVTIHEAE
jgi:transcription elongation factor GreA